MEIVFDGAYSSAFTTEAIKAEYASAKEIGKKIDPRYYIRQRRFKRKSLEMFLLADNVHLVGADNGVNYDKLLDTGLISIENIELKERYQWKKRKSIIENTSFKTYITPLKPWIVRHAVQGFLLKGKKAIANIGLTPNKFVSAVFDDILDKEVTADFNDRAGLALWEMQPNGMKMYSSNDCYLIYKQTTLFPLMVYMVDLFEVTARRQSLLCSNSINKRSIRGLDNRLKSVNAKPISDACGVLRVSLADTIGCVPKLHTIDQVLYLKKTKAKQIEGLNDALKELSI